MIKLYNCSLHKGITIFLCNVQIKRKYNMLASLTNINKFYNGAQVLCNVSLTIDENDKIGLVGRNGCGKSTLLKILTGAVEPDRFTEKDGIISRAAKTTVGYLEQMGGLNTENTVIEESPVTSVTSTPWGLPSTHTPCHRQTARDRDRDRNRR